MIKFIRMLARTRAQCHSEEFSVEQAGFGRRYEGGAGGGGRSASDNDSGWAYECVLGLCTESWKPREISSYKSSSGINLKTFVHA